MKDRDFQATTSISSNQSVNTMLGGVAADVYIQSLTGSVVVRPSSPPEPPALDTIKNYLRVAQQETKSGRPTASDSYDWFPTLLETETLSSEATTKLETLWCLPFRAHKSGELCQPFEDVVIRLLDQSQRCNRYQRLVLMADAGMGKTPALESLMAKTAKQSLEVIESPPDPEKARSGTYTIPIYMKLARLQANQPFVAMMCDAFNAITDDKITNDQALGILASMDSQCLFLMDDLDLLLSQTKQGAFQMLCQLMETYHEHRYVVSCRTSNYRQQLGFLDVLFLDELKPNEVKAVIGEKGYAKLSSASPKLAHNRAALEQFIRQGGATELPPTKGRYLQTLVEGRLKKNSVQLTDQDLSETIIQGLLESLAIHMRLDHAHHYDEHQLMVMITEFLEQWREVTPWRRVLTAFDEFDWLEHDQNYLWCFRDRCDEAYFAASAVVHNPAHRKVLIHEASDPWWRDVFEILIGICQDPQVLLIDLIDRDVFVAANCIRHVAEPVAQACQEALVDALVEEFQKESSARRTFIAERLGESEHHRAGQALLQILHREWSSMVLMAALTALVSWGNRQTDARKAIREAELKTPHRLAGKEQHISDLLDWCWVDEAQDDWTEQTRFLLAKRKSVRARGLTALGLGLKQVNEARGTLLQLVQAQSTDEELAWCAVEALALLPPSEQVIAWAKKTARTTDRSLLSQRRRARAVYLLGRLGADEETGALLRQALTDQQNYLVRGYAATSMAHLDVIGARAEVEKLMNTETVPWVMHQAAEALGQIGTLDTLPVLQRQLRNQQISTRRIVNRAMNEILERNAL